MARISLLWRSSSCVRRCLFFVVLLDEAGAINSVAASGDERLRLAGEVTMISSSSMVARLDLRIVFDLKGMSGGIVDLEVATRMFT